MKLDILRFRIGQSLLLVGPVTTLAINPWTNFDPISVVKLSVISTFSFLALFLILSNREITKSVDKSLKICLGVFVSLYAQVFSLAVLRWINSFGAFLEEVQVYLLILVWGYSSLLLQHFVM